MAMAETMFTPRQAYGSDCPDCAYSFMQFRFSNLYLLLPSQLTVNINS